MDALACVDSRYLIALGSPASGDVVFVCTMEVVVLEVHEHSRSQCIYTNLFLSDIHTERKSGCGTIVITPGRTLVFFPGALGIGDAGGEEQS